MCLGHYGATWTSTSALRTPSQGGPELPRLHALQATAPRSGRDTVLPCGLWHMTKASRRSLTQASNMGATYIKCRQDVHMFAPLIGGMRPIRHGSR